MNEKALFATRQEDQAVGWTGRLGRYVGMRRCEFSGGDECFAGKKKRARWKREYAGSSFYFACDDCRFMLGG